MVSLNSIQSVVITETSLKGDLKLVKQYKINRWYNRCVSVVAKIWRRRTVIRFCSGTSMLAVM